MSEFPGGASYRFPPPTEPRFPPGETRFAGSADPRFSNGNESRFFPNDARRPLPPPKRRRDFPEAEEVGPRGTFPRGPDREGVFPGRMDRGFDDRMAQRGAWREQEPLPPGDMGPFGGLGPGMGGGMGIPTGGGGNGPMGGMGMSGMPEDPMMGPPGARGMPPVDVGMGRPVNINGLGVGGSEMGGRDLLPPDASATLFVDGFPANCSKREAAHIFRPFIGYKEVRLVHKEPKRNNGEKLVLCFVEFTDPRCAATALEALQGYKFDESDHTSPSLRLNFARNPAPRGVAHGRPRDASYRSPIRMPPADFDLR